MTHVYPFKDEGSDRVKSQVFDKRASTSAGDVATANANYVWAGPTTGAPGAVTFRALVNADIPAALTGKTYNGLSVAHNGAGTFTIEEPFALHLLTVSDSTTLNGGTVNGGTHSGTNTGDQDLSAYATTAAVAAGYQPLDTQLTSLAALTYGSNSLKVVRVKADESGFELATVSAGSTPTGTGFPHITAGVQDGAAKLVDTADINNDQVTYAKIQNAAANTFIARAANSSGDLSEVALSASQLAGRGSTGDVAAITLGTGLNMSGTTLSASVAGYDAGSIPQVIQEAVASGNNGYWSVQPGIAGPVLTGWGIPSGNVQAGASAATGAITATNLLTRSARYTFVSATSAGSSCSLIQGGALCAPAYGFHFAIRGAVEDAATVANSRWFMGLRASIVAIGNVNPSSLVDIVGLGCDAGETTLSIMHNNGSGTATKVSLGANFPAQTLVDVYRLSLSCAVGGATINYHVLRENTGDIASGSITTDLPTSTNYMAAQWWRNNGSTGLAVKVACMSFYLKWNTEA